MMLEKKVILLIKNIHVCNLSEYSKSVKQVGKVNSISLSQF